MDSFRIYQEYELNSDQSNNLCHSTRPGDQYRLDVRNGSLAACQHHISPTAAFERIAVIRQ